MVQIRVIGSGQATTAPDEAGFQFHCKGTAPEAPEALAKATTAAEDVVTVLDRLGVPTERRGVQRAHVHPRVRWVDDDEVRDGWDADVSVDCSIEDPAMAYEVLEEVAAVDGVSIQGPHWRIRRENPAHEAARHQAVNDGREKAQSYASAADLTLGDLLELVEGGADRGEPRMRHMAMAESASLEAADQVVNATVTLVFDAT